MRGMVVGEGGRSSGVLLQYKSFIRNESVLVTFHGGSFVVDFLKNEAVGFDENLVSSFVM